MEHKYGDPVKCAICSDWGKYNMRPGLTFICDKCYQDKFLMSSYYRFYWDLVDGNYPEEILSKIFDLWIEDEVAHRKEEAKNG